MRILYPVVFAALILASSNAHALAASDANFASAAFASLIDWQRGIVQEIGRILILVRDGASLIALLSSAGLAFLYGMLSELSSGHGKLVAAAYLAGRPAKRSGRRPTSRPSGRPKSIPKPTTKISPNQLSE